MAYDDIMLESEDRMDKAVKHLHEEYKKVRTGRASTGLVENLKIDYYDTPTPIKQIAAIGVPEARLIVIRPYDPTTISLIEKGIMKSDIGITPQNDGKVIRLVVPPLSEDRRKQYVTQTKQMAEDAKIAIRNVRRDAIKDAEKEEKDGDMTEDDLGRFKEEIQKLTDDYTKKAEEMHEIKAKELMEV